MNEQKRVPKLRFAEFSGKWETKTVGDIADITKLAGYEYTKHVVYSDSGSIIGLRALNIKNNIITLDDVQYIDNSDFSKLGRSKLYIGDLLFTYIGANIGDVAIVPENDKFYLAPNISRIRCTESLALNQYVFQYFRRNKFYKTEIVKYIASSSQPALGMGNIRKLSIALPPLPEQQKIASFLSSVDKKIQQLQQKKHLLEQYKKGVILQIFSQQLRFTKPDGRAYPDWEFLNLKNVLFEHKTKNAKNEIKEVFSVAKEKGVVNQIEHLGRSYAADSILHYKIVKPYDVIYTKSPTKDFPFGIIKQNLTNRTGVVSPLYVVLKPINKSVGFILHCYFESWINTYNYLNPLVQKGAKNTMNINNDDFLKGSKIKLPISDEEQTQIADFLSAIDKKIAVVQTQIEHTQMFKKGLLQQLFV